MGRKRRQTVDGKSMFPYIGGLLFITAIVLQTVGITLPLYQLLYTGWSEVRIDVHGYEEPIFVLFYAAFIVLAFVAVFRSITSRKRVMDDLARIVSYFAPVSAVLLLCVILEALPNYYYAGLAIPEANRNLNVILMPGFFLYVAGLVVLVLFQVVKFSRGSSPTMSSHRIREWLLRNRIGFTGMLLLLVFALFTQLRYIDFQTMQVTIGTGSLDSLTDARPLSELLLGLITYLFPPLILLGTVALDFMIALAGGRALAAKGRPSLGEARPGRTLLRWVAWTLPASLMLWLMMITADQWYAFAPTPLVGTAGITFQSLTLDLYLIYVYLGPLFLGYQLAVILIAFALSIAWIALMPWVVDLAILNHLSGRGRSLGFSL